MVFNWGVEIDKVLRNRSDEMQDYNHVYMNDSDYLEFLDESLASWEKEKNRNVKFVYRQMRTPYTVRAIGTIEKGKLLVLNVELPYGIKLN